IVGFFLALTHGIVSLFFLPTKFPLAIYFARLNWPFIFGLAGVVLLTLIFLISNKWVENKIGYKTWWRLQNWGLRLVVGLTVLHVFVMKWNGWIKWYRLGGEVELAHPELPGGGVLVGWLLFFAVLIRLAEFGGARFGRLVCYISALLIPVVFTATFWWGRQFVKTAQATPPCLTRDEVANAVSAQKKCLAIYNGKVYDLTTAKMWDLTGHVGKHLCGKEYDKETIEKGPHLASVMGVFFLTKLCTP
ncbi:MAG: hypothetical protein WAV56_00785, partial [Microgenomates group bacterium]